MRSYCFFLPIDGTVTGTLNFAACVKMVSPPMRFLNRVSASYLSGLSLPAVFTQSGQRPKAFYPIPVDIFFTLECLALTIIPPPSLPVCPTLRYRRHGRHRLRRRRDAILIPPSVRSATAVTNGNSFTPRRLHSFQLARQSTTHARRKKGEVRFGSAD